MEKQNNRESKKGTGANNSTCLSCGQKFSFWQRFLVSNHATLTCKKCKARYTVFMRMNTGKVGGLGGGLGGACIIAGYLIGDRYFLSPFWGLSIGVLIAGCISFYIYRYTWRKVELHPQR